MRKRLDVRHFFVDEVHDLIEGLEHIQAFEIFRLRDLRVERGVEVEDRRVHAADLKQFFALEAGLRDVREELQSAIASVPSIVKDLSEKERADDGQSTFKRLVDHVEGVASTMRARQTEHERKFRQAVADIEENRRALDDMTARVEQRLDALRATLTRLLPTELAPTLAPPPALPPSLPPASPVNFTL